MKKRAMLVGMVLALVAAGAAVAAAGFHAVSTGTYDPKKTYLAGSDWVSGIGCPTNSKVTFDGTTVSSYTDPACTSGDSKDSHNMGLLLAKTGPTGNYAAGLANLKSTPAAITELGYDLRKPGTDQNDTRGSHCGAGAPRFDLVAVNGDDYFVGCNSPAPTAVTVGSGWLRLRWTAPVMAYGPSGLVDISAVQFKQIQIVMDEGQDTGPDNTGLAVLDNIDVNGTLVGK